jgi:2-polyprenyl-3-methyl-5-hydroxy-6-metoxy-1,4-benzoquinol methylase
MTILSSIIKANFVASKWFDSTFLPLCLAKDGNRDFIDNVAPLYLVPGLKIYDVGGGKQPFVSLDKKKILDLHIVGLDIDQDELNRAPLGAYDEMMCIDISQVSGKSDGDLVICQAVLEHVRDTENAMKSISSLLKPGGKALIFVPSRNAVFARLNLMLPERVKRSLLFAIYPQTRTAQGFPSYYNNCTPRNLSSLAESSGMSVRKSYCYYMSGYFSFLFPLYVLWRLWILLFKTLSPAQASETFILVLEKN